MHVFLRPGGDQMQDIVSRVARLRLEHLFPDTLTVVVALTPELLNNCSLVIRLQGGDITGQFATSPGPAPKPLALTGGTGAYHNVGGEGTLVEFGNDKGSLTLHVLSFAPRGKGA